MLKKFVSLVVGAAFVLATIGASATPTVLTRSTYQSDVSMVKVVTTVGNLSAGDVCTYLAYEEDATLGTLTDVESGLIFVDQKKATGAQVTFEYVTATSNVGGNILVGGTIGGSAATPVEDTIPAIPSYTVQVGGDVVASGAFDNLEGEANTNFVKVPADFEGNITGVTVGGVATQDYLVANDGVYISAAALKAAVAANDNVAAIVLSVAGFETAVADLVKAGFIANDTEGSDVANSVIVTATVVGDAAEYGIVFSSDKDDFETDAKIVKARALGRGTNGLFAVKLFDFDNEGVGKFEAGQPIYAKVYYDSNLSDATAMIETAL